MHNTERTKRIQIGVRLDAEEFATLSKFAKAFGVGAPAALRMLLRLKADEVIATNRTAR